MSGLPIPAALIDALLPLLGRALTTIFSTAALLVLVAAIACTTLGLTHGWPGVAIPALLVVGAGALLIPKRLVGQAIITFVERVPVVNRLVDAIFARMVGPAEERSRIGDGVEKLPLAQAEQRLHAACAAVLEGQVSRGGLRGWLAKRVMNHLVARIEKLTLASMRTADRDEVTGIDLALVRMRLQQELQERLLDHVRGAGRRLLVLVLVGYTALAWLLTALAAGALN